MKSKDWFYKQCLVEVRQYSPFAYLCWDILQKGIGQADATRGHVHHSIGAVQKFLARHRHFLERIRNSDRTRPYPIDDDEEMLDAWIEWFRDQAGEYGPHSSKYSFDTLRTYLTRHLGGRQTSGGGGNDEFKKVLRLTPEFLGRS